MRNIRKICHFCIVVFFTLIGTQIAVAKTFKMAIGDAAGGTQWELGTKFRDLMAESSQGKVNIELFPNGQLGNEQDTVNNAAIGLLDFSILAINNVTPFSPTVGLLTMPYLIQSTEEAVELTQGKTGQELTENTIRDAGVRIIGWAYSGFRVLTNSKKPVRSPEDLKGLVIRVPRNEIMIASYQAWGVNLLQWLGLRHLLAFSKAWSMDKTIPISRFMRCNLMKYKNM